MDLLFCAGIRVWRGDWAVWGLQFQWGEGDFGKVYGDDSDGTKRRDPDQELKWKPADEVGKSHLCRTTESSKAYRY